MVLNSVYNISFDNLIKHFNQPSLQFHKQIYKVEIQDYTVTNKQFVLSNPVVSDSPPIVISSDDMTLDHLVDNSAIVPQDLPLEAQRLFGKISGPLIKLKPNDICSIQYSIDTPNMTLFNRLANKTTFGNPITTYIRVTIGKDQGNSPGVLFVLEIWPQGHNSPIHDHGNSVAIIKVLSGEIQSESFNPIDRGVINPIPILKKMFKKGDITYLTPLLYQTHRLTNIHPTKACITLQSYQYLDLDYNHYEFFDWLDKDGNIQHFTPGSDFELSDLLHNVTAEYAVCVSKGLCSCVA